MGNAWVSPLISHSTGKCNKTHCTRRNWEIGTHTFPIVWVLFSYSISILWYTSSYGKCMGFLINFPLYGKRQQNPSNGESLRNWFPYSFHCMGVFSIRFPSSGILHHMGNAYVFSHWFPISWNRQQNFSNGESLGNWFPHFFYSMSAFYH